MRRRASFAGFLLLLAGAGLGAGRASAVEFRIVVNTASPVSSLTRRQIAAIFLKKLDRWENGEKVLPVDLGAESAVRAQFSKTIHDKPVAAVRSYWQQKIFSGRGVPPPEKATEKDVLEYVRANAGGIGYIGAGIAADKVKVVKVTE